MPAAAFYQMGLSILISTVLIGLGMFPRTRLIGLVLCGLGMILAIVWWIPNPWLRWNGFVLAPILLLCLCLKSSPRTTLCLCSVPILLVLGLVARNRFTEVQRIDRLRVRYPRESLSPRLAYEERATKSLSFAILPHPVAAKLDEFDETATYSQSMSSRLIRLRLLHDESYREFVATSGFGFSRTRPNTLQTLDIPDPQPIRMPKWSSQWDDNLSHRGGESTSAPPLEASASPDGTIAGQSIHSSAIYDFLDPQQWGYVIDRDHTVGFQSHRLGAPTWTDFRSDEPVRPWTVVRMQLVSLLKHPQPRVYVSENFPDLSELANVETRDVNAFEAASLPLLNRTQDVVIHEKPSKIQMMGALRAATSCLECHRVPRGTLLGAFSYVLVPTDQRTSTNL